MGQLAVLMLVGRASGRFHPSKPESGTVDVTPESKSDLASEVADIRKVPMARLAETQRGLIAETLRRIVPDNSATSVPVASAFNSSI